MLSWLLQEVEALKEQLAAMQEAQPMMAARRTMLRSPFGSPIDPFSSAQVCRHNAILLAIRQHLLLCKQECSVCLHSLC